MRLSILMMALHRRRHLRQLVESELRNQAQNLPVEILVLEDDGRMPCGEKRNRLTAMAQGDYIAFVDDDDMVTGAYIDAILQGTAGNPDVVTFRLEQQHANLARSRFWRFGLYAEDETAIINGWRKMVANHLCAWRRELASRVPWVPTLAYMDDCFWYRGMQAAGFGKTERHVASVLYRYQFDWRVTACQTPAAQMNTRAWAKAGIDYYWWRGDQIAIALHNRKANALRPMIDVVTAGGVVRQVHKAELKHFYTSRVK